MRTIFKFVESIDKIKVTLIHSKYISITQEIHNDRYQWEDAKGNIIKERPFIVIRFPKNLNVDLNLIENKKYDRNHVVGLVINELDNITEIMFYDRITFTWIASSLEEAGLLKVNMQIIPDFKNHGELFSNYINAKGLYQWSYNIITTIIQLPFLMYKENYNKNNKYGETKI